MTTTLVDRVKITVMSSGTGPFELGAAVPAYRGVEALVDGATYSYAVESNSQYEAGTGTYVAGTGTFVRVPQISSNGGATVAFPANVQLIFTALAVDYGSAAGAEAGAAAGAAAGTAAGAAAATTAIAALHLGSMSQQVDAGLEFTDSFDGGAYPGVEQDGQFSFRNNTPLVGGGADWQFIGVDATVPSFAGTMSTMRVSGIQGENNHNWEFTNLTYLLMKGPPDTQPTAQYTQGERVVRSDMSDGGFGFIDTKEFYDRLPNPTQGGTVQELDYRAKGGDSLGVRQVQHVVFSTDTLDDSAARIERGIRFTPVGAGVVVGKCIVWDTNQYEHLLWHANFNVTPTGDLTLAGNQMSGGKITLNRPTATPAANVSLNLQIDGVTYGTLQQDSGSATSLRIAGGTGFNVSSTVIGPLTDNAQSGGDASHRYTQLFAVTTTVSSSDARIKTPPRDFTDAELDAIGEVHLVAYQYLDAVAAKGRDDARIHAGAIAQQVEAAFEKHGLDVRRYALFCEDPLMETVEEPYEALVHDIETISVPTSRVEVVDGKAIEYIDQVPTERPAFDILLLFDSEGRPKIRKGMPAQVWTDKETGKTVTTVARPDQQETYSSPRMTMKTLMRPVKRQQTDEEGHPLTRLSLRYDHLHVMLLAWVRREIGKLAE